MRLLRRSQRRRDVSGSEEGGPRGGSRPNQGSEAAGEGGHGEEVQRADGELNLSETDELRKQNKRRSCSSSSYSNMRGSVQGCHRDFVVFDYDYVNIKKRDLT